MARQRGFFDKLFDFSFSEFVAVQIIGVVYAIGLILLGLAALGIIIAGFSQGFTSGIVTLVVAPLAFFLYVILLRIGLEGFVAAIRTAENTRIIAENTRRSGF